MFNFLFFPFLHQKKFEIITWLRHRPRNFHLGFHLRTRKTKNNNKNPKIRNYWKILSTLRPDLVTLWSCCMTFGSCCVTAQERKTLRNASSQYLVISKPDRFYPWTPCQLHLFNWEKWPPVYFNLFLKAHRQMEITVVRYGRVFCG